MGGVGAPVVIVVDILSVDLPSPIGPTVCTGAKWDRVRGLTNTVGSLLPLLLLPFPLETPPPPPSLPAKLPGSLAAVPG